VQSHRNICFGESSLLVTVSFLIFIVDCILLLLVNITIIQKRNLWSEIVVLQNATSTETYLLIMYKSVYLLTMIIMQQSAKLKSLCKLQGGDPFTKELKVRGRCWSTVVTVVAVKMEEVAE